MEVYKITCKINCESKLCEIKDGNYTIENIEFLEGMIEESKEKGESDLRTYGFAIETHLAKQVLEELLEKRK